MLQIIIPISLFLSASLLFVLQPMVGKVLLPVYGGTPAVWTVCMLFFQTVLLIAYAYAWMLSRLQGTRRWRTVHVCICILSLLSLPLVFSPSSTQGSPETHILLSLLQLGLPLFVIGASAPLLQFAFSQSVVTRARDPYFLYAASNAGSLLALLSYPWLIERFSGIHMQFNIWNGLYGLYLVLLFLILFTARYESIGVRDERKHAITKRQALKWIGLSFIPCSLMLSVTFYISTDVAATPLFWVLPLALYLLSFVITFAQKPIISHVHILRVSLFFIVLPLISFTVSAHSIPGYLLIVTHLVSFFVLALLCHGELVNSRPDVSQLTVFYFCLALGGVLAGIFNGLISPHLFVHAYEYPLVIALAIFAIRPVRLWRILLILSILVFVAMMSWSKASAVLSQKRNFYGIKEVFSHAGAHVLMSQSTIHGFQVFGDENPTDGARAYYASVLPVVQRLQLEHQPLHAMVLGLGTGIMACQFRSQDQLKIVEIDQQVIDIARNPKLFSYLRDCPPQTNVVLDDGLLAVKATHNASLELLVMDAFTSDAIPVHLLTLEAFTLYQKKITQEGVILVNISNRHLRVLPVLTAAARRLDMIVLHKQLNGDNRLGQLASEWALLTSNERLASRLLSKEGWRFVADADTYLWTNDYSNLVPLLKWFKDA